MAKRKSLSTKDRARIFKLHGGKCHLCGGIIDGTREAWEVSHDTPLEMGGADDDTNRFPAHKKCHRTHTATVDIPNIAEAKRREARHTGAHVPKATIPAPPRRPREPRRLAEELPPLPRRAMFR